jgi:hypothetical protein
VAFSLRPIRSWFTTRRVGVGSQFITGHHVSPFTAEPVMVTDTTCALDGVSVRAITTLSDLKSSSSARRGESSDGNTV